MGLLIMNVHVLSSASLVENLYPPFSKAFMEICISAGPLCGAVLFLAESYKSFTITKQVFLLTIEQLKPITNKCGMFSEIESASACKYCSFLLRHHGCVCLLPSREAVDVMLRDDAIIPDRTL